VGEIVFTYCEKCGLVLIHIEAMNVTIIASSSLQKRMQAQMGWLVLSLQKRKQAQMGWLVSVNFLCPLLL